MMISVIFFPEKPDEYNHKTHKQIDMNCDFKRISLSHYQKCVALSHIYILTCSRAQTINLTSNIYPYYNKGLLRRHGELGAVVMATKCWWPLLTLPTLLHIPHLWQYSSILWGRRKDFPVRWSDHPFRYFVPRVTGLMRSRVSKRILLIQWKYSSWCCHLSSQGESRR